LRKLLRRFLDVCNAVDYAHSRGVIHRDIKPANIILGKHGETLVVDWGLAKAVGRADPSVGEQTIAPSSSGSSETLPGSALGTPAYMSPEQAAGDLHRLGPRADVYSLGATLYCLLTGKPPFEGDDLGGVLGRVQAGAFRAPREVDPSLDKAVEAVCLKAMASKPADRYGSGRALADDIERWMADEPVTAYPEPWDRTLVRWLTRHRTGVTGVAAAVLAGVVGLSAVLAVQTRANAQLTQSRAAVQARYDLAVDAIKTFHTGVSEDFLLKQDEFKEQRDRLLKSASDFYGKLGALLGKGTDVASRRALARSNFELADLTGKVGDKQAALAAHRAVLPLREALASEPGADLKLDVGKSLTAVAGLLQETGKTDEALAAYRRSESLLAGLAASDPAARAALAACRSGLGYLLFTAEKYTDALAAYRLARADQEALAASPTASDDARRDLGSTFHLIARLLLTIGETAAAEAEYRRALEIKGKLADDNPAVTGFRSSLAASHNSLGSLLTWAGRRPEAEAEYRKALAIVHKVANDNPAVAEFRNALALGHANLGWVLSAAGKLAEAEAEYRKALAIVQKLADANPTVIEFHERLASFQLQLGGVLMETASPAEAEAEFRRSLAIAQKLADANPTVIQLRSGLADGHEELGDMFMKTGKPAEAEAEFRKSLAIAQKLADANPTDTRAQRKLAGAYGWIGEVLSRTGKLAGALTAWREDLSIRQSLVEANPGFDRLRVDVAWCHSRIGHLLLQTGKPVEAMEEYGKALSINRELADAHPDDKSFLSGWGHSHDGVAGGYNNIGRVLARRKRFAEAVAHIDAGLAIRQKLAGSDPANTEHANSLGSSYAYRGETRASAGQPALAAADLRRALELWAKVAHLDIEMQVERARALALLAGLGVDAKSGVTKDEASTFADQSVAALAAVVKAGWALPTELKEPDFDALRGRADFQELVAEVEAKAGPRAKLKD
jgi:eukaryotic-like serine/threonine-protein kinase